MIELKKAFQNITDDEMTQLLDLPIWLALLAAFTGDGRVSEGERAEAVKLAHLRTFTSHKSLQEFYTKVDERFATRFDKLITRVPKGEKDREVYIEAQIKLGHAILLKLDTDIAATLEDSLESFYSHVFKADKSFFQYFALPIISNRLDKQSGHYDFDKK